MNKPPREGLGVACFIVEPEKGYERDCERMEVLKNTREERKQET